MARKVKKTKPKSRVADSDEDDGAASDSDNAGPLDQDKLVEMVEALTDKRVGTRVKAMQSLTKTMQRTILQDFVLSRRDTLIQYLSAPIRKGRTEEIVAACGCLTTAIISLGMEGGNMFAELFPKFETMVKDETRDRRARAAAVRTLGVACFVTSEEAQESTMFTKLLADLWKQGLKRAKTEKGPELTEQVVLSFGLMCSVMPLSDLATDAVPKYFKPLVLLLDHPALEVKTAVGSVLALMYETHQQATGKHLPEADNLVDALYDLAKSSDKKITRKERAKQRATFRQVLKSVQEGEVPEDQLKIGPDKHCFEGWRQMLQLDAMRASLAGGLQTHLKGNELLQQIFDLQFVDSEVVEGASSNRKRAERAAERRANARDIEEHIGKERKKKLAFLQGVHEDD